ncbi:ribosomal protein S18-alanine N-acetyltransferase [Schaalia sp. lx-260]|nr:ribosomal protein S18-alanine N-acetyltransferase [Schaalia sp. lx-260]MCD4549816.1 ribosomal protein S18-alanine N-acetyltransferase [Schaalia sp. lx-260]
MVTPSYEYHRLGVADCETVYACECEVFAEDPWTYSMIEQELSSPHRYYVGAFLGSVLAGWAGISIGIDADVMTIGVREQFRGTGVGHALMSDVLAVALDEGAQRIFLEVRESNVGAIHMYERHGFFPIGRVKNYFRYPREDALTMRKDALSGSKPASNV